jgi:hypothetical protein
MICPFARPKMPQQRVGWQPSRFLTDRAEAERAFQLAERLGSVNAAVTQLGAIQVFFDARPFAPLFEVASARRRPGCRRPGPTSPPTALLAVT